MGTNNHAAPRLVTREVTLELIDPSGRALALDARFSYDTSDPYAVTATFLVDGPPVVWTFARDLLIGGLSEPTGDGDVHVWPCLDADGAPVVIIELSAPAGDALIQARTADVTAFVEQITRTVQPGHESDFVDVDGLIGAIFATPLA